MEDRMMKRMVSLITVIGLIVIITGCSATRQNIAVSRYTFNFEGKMYVIESMTPDKTEGYNVLLHKVDEKMVMRAIDKEQDGRLDSIMKGTISLDDADRIYNAGIAMGRAKGQVKKRDFTRVYRTSDLMNDYVLKTYILTIGEEYNMDGFIGLHTLTLLPLMFLSYNPLNPPLIRETLVLT